MTEIGIFRIIWELGFWKLNLRIGVLEIKFGRNWELKKIVWKLELWKLNLRIGVLEIKFERNWKLKKKLFDNWSFENGTFYKKKLNLEIGTLENYVKIEFKINK